MRTSIFKQKTGPENPERSHELPTQWRIQKTNLYLISTTMIYYILYMIFTMNTINYWPNFQSHRDLNNI